jgi:hypothetical protein
MKSFNQSCDAGTQNPSLIFHFIEAVEKALQGRIGRRNFQFVLEAQSLENGSVIHL